jgi:hypothetical protein
MRYTAYVRVSEGSPRNWRAETPSPVLQDELEGRARVPEDEP